MNTRPFELLAGLITVVAPVSFGYFFYTGRAVPAPKIDQRTMASLSSSVSNIPWSNVASTSATTARTGWFWSKDMFVGRVVPATSSFLSTSRSAWSRADIKNMSLESMVFEPTARLSAAFAGETQGADGRSSWGYWCLSALLFTMLVALIRIGWSRVDEQARQRITGKIPAPVKILGSFVIDKIVWPVFRSRPVRKIFSPVRYTSYLLSPHSARKLFFEWLKKELQGLNADGGGQQALGLDPTIKRQIEQMLVCVDEMKRTCASLDQRTRDTLNMLDDVEARVKACEGWQRACELRGGFSRPANGNSN